MNEDLRIRLGFEEVPFRFKITLQFPEIIDLPVKNDPDGTIFIAERLPSRVQIDDGEAPMCKADLPIRPEPLPIWAPVGHSFGHLSQPILVDLSTICPQEACNTAHSIHPLAQHGRPFTRA